MHRRKIIQLIFPNLLSSWAVWGATDLSAKEIMEKNFFSSKISSLKTDATMLLVNDRGQTRERRITTIQKLQKNGIDSKMVMKFKAPADIKGIGFLQIEQSETDDDQWIYLPSLKKTRRLVANNKKDSFMGSDFSYGDFSRPKVDWYLHRFLRNEAIDGRDCFVVESTPRDTTIRNDHGYSKKVQWIRKDSFLEAKVEYYDLSTELLKTQTISDHKLVEPSLQRWFAMHRHVVNHQTQHKTLLDFYNVDINVSTPDSLFSTRTIENE